MHRTIVTIICIWRFKNYQNRDGTIFECPTFIDSILSGIFLFELYGDRRVFFKCCYLTKNEITFSIILANVKFYSTKRNVKGCNKKHLTAYVITTLDFLNGKTIQQHFSCQQTNTTDHKTKTNIIDPTVLNFLLTLCN